MHSSVRYLLGYLDPILCCVSGFPNIGGGVFSGPQGMQKPCRLWVCASQVLRSGPMLSQAAVMNYNECSSAQAGVIFCLNWKTAAETKSSDSQLPPDFSLNTTLWYIIFDPFYPLSPERITLEECCREAVLMVLKAVTRMMGQDGDDM